MFKIVEREIKRTRPLELVRNFISDSLYNTSYGYFNERVKIIPVGKRINFNLLGGEREYRKAVQRVYGYDKYVEYQDENKFQNAWHTPSEIFFPYYGQAIAKKLVQTLKNYPEIAARNDGKLIIIEIGPGNGNLCHSILDFIKNSYPQLFSHLEYHLIEISPIFHKSYQENLLECFGNQCRFHNWSVLDMAKIKETFQDYADKHCFILGFEVLDNLAHDKIMYSQDGSLKQFYIESNDNAAFGQVGYREHASDVIDPVILNLINILESIGYKSPSLRWNTYDILYDLVEGSVINPWRTEFIPTGMYQLLNNVIDNFPYHSLFLGDFCMLPERINGHNGPLVQTCLRGKTTSVSTYLVKRGFFDIMFETNFALLQAIYNTMIKMKGKAASVDTQIFTHVDLMLEYADVNKTRLLNGKNPLLEEYFNVKYFEGTVLAD